MFQAGVKGMSERSELMSVCDVRAGGHENGAKNISFSSSLDLDDTRGSGLTQQAMTLAVDQSKPLEKGGWAELDRKVDLRAAAW